MGIFCAAKLKFDSTYTSASRLYSGRLCFINAVFQPSRLMLMSSQEIPCVRCSSKIAFQCVSAEPIKLCSDNSNDDNNLNKASAKSNPDVFIA